VSYLDFYRLQTEPFSNAPNERFYYNSAQHARALTRIMYITETMKGLAVVVGDIGTGKTEGQDPDHRPALPSPSSTA
jgi:type II secretory pathway predicted ATPase ExeA